MTQGALYGASIVVKTSTRPAYLQGTPGHFAVAASKVSDFAGFAYFTQRSGDRGSEILTARGICTPVTTMNGVRSARM